MNTPKPVACSKVIVGGIESSCQCTTASTSAGASYLKMLVSTKAALS
jgi:hypothetical protein